MKKVLGFKSIRFQIPVLLCLTVMLPLIVLWQNNYADINRMTMEKAESTIQNDLSNKALAIDYVQDEVTHFASSLNGDSDVIKLITAYATDSGQEKNVIRSNLTRHLVQLLLRTPAVNAVYILIEGEEFVISTITGQKEISRYTSEGNEIMTEYEQDLAGRVTWVSSHMRTGQEETSLSYYMPLKNDDGLSCSIVCNVNMQYIDKLIESFPFENSDLVVCDFRGNTMLSTQVDGVSRDLAQDRRYTRAFESKDRSGSYIIDVDGQERLVEYYLSMTTMWKYIESTKVDGILNMEQVQTNNLFLSLIIVIAVSVFGSYIVTRLILNPITRMLGSMKQTEKGNFRPVHGQIPSSEMGIMINGYNSMVNKLEKLIDDVYVQEILRKEAQLRTLQFQMNEHFLYNTLNTIFCVIDRRDVELAKEMLIMLSRFFRLSLSDVFVNEKV